MGNKLVIFVSLLVSIMLMLNLLGLITGGVFGFLYGLATNPSGLKDSNFYVQAGILLTSVVGTALIIIGSFTSGRSDLAIKAPLMIIMLPIASDIVALYTTLTSYGTTAGVIGLLICSPLAILWVLTIIEWWGGHD